jgi:ribonuclease HI
VSTRELAEHFTEGQDGGALLSLREPLAGSAPGLAAAADDRRVRKGQAAALPTREHSRRVAFDQPLTTELDDKRNAAPCCRDQAWSKNGAEAMKRATIHFDGGGQSPGPVTAACTVELSDGSFGQDVKRFDQGTHNIAEWHALILGLRMALKHGERHVVVKGDSMLVVKQINREWKTKNAALRSLRAQAEELLALFETWRVEWIPRKENRRTDQLGRAQ